MRVTNLIFGLLTSAAFSAGFAGSASAKTLNAVASFTVLADVVRQVGGDHVNVKSLVPADGDPHEFE
ncbi:MAG TPA: zinc ABC transporter substrate-binding protein, partial [Hyphomicrobium sp.]|nr:zinc ABC transporter substrate-binding protein [Hyphomicrobium sp.]